MVILKTIRKALRGAVLTPGPVGARRQPLNDTDFPPQVWIENTNHCNAACVMCPRELQTRPLGLMDLDLYKKVIHEVAQHRAEVTRVHMHNYGEPLLDKKLPIRIRLAKELGIRHVYMVTNASLLTEKRARGLIEAGLDEFKISFYGTDRDSYNGTMINLDFDDTLNNLKRFFAIRRELGASRPMVVLQFIPVQATTGRYEDFMKIFESLIDPSIGDRLQVTNLHNFGSGRGYVDVRSKSYSNVCNSPWKTIVILQDGNVAPCCFDFNGRMVMGSVREHTIHEIWNNAVYRKMRQDFRDLRYGQYGVCTKCSVPYKVSQAEDL